jgi:hypothetical protein
MRTGSSAPDDFTKSRAMRSARASSCWGSMPRGRPALVSPVAPARISASRYRRTCIQRMERLMMSHTQLGRRAALWVPAPASAQKRP